MNKPVQFTIQKEIQSDQLVITVKNNVTHELFSIFPYSGARVGELHLSNGTIPISVLKKINNPSSIERDEVFTNAKLSPFAGRIKSGTYKINGTSFHLPINYPEENNACHGFIFDKKFEVVRTEVQNDRVLCLLKYDYQGEVTGFPFNYSVELLYTLTATGEFICETKVKNHSLSAMPLSDGWHHYFDVGENINDLRLELEVTDMMELDQWNIPTGQNIPFPRFRFPEKIGEQFFDSCFRMKSTNGKASTRLISERKEIDLKIWQETGQGKYNYLVIYTPPERSSIAIEPMTANVNAFNNKEDLIMLESGAETMFRIGMIMNKPSRSQQ